MQPHNTSLLYTALALHIQIRINTILICVHLRINKFTNKYSCWSLPAARRRLILASFSHFSVVVRSQASLLNFEKVCRKTVRLAIPSKRFYMLWQIFVSGTRSVSIYYSHYGVVGYWSLLGGLRRRFLSMLLYLYITIYRKHEWNRYKYVIAALSLCTVI